MFRRASGPALARRIPPAGAAAVIAACADSAPPTQEHIFAAIAEQRPDAVVFAGDASYAGVSDRTRKGSLRRWREGWGPLVDRLYAVPGNHDVHSPDGLRAWRRSVPAAADAPPGEQGLGFAVRVGPVLAVGVTPIRRVVPRPQLEWLERRLARSDAPHRIAVFHEPAWPCGRRRGQSLDAYPEERDRLWRVLEDGAVTLVLNGHEHGYSRRTVVRERPIVQVICAGAGAPLYGEHGEADASVPAFHYMLIEAGPAELVCRALALDGRLLDEVSIRAGAPSPDGERPGGPSSAPGPDAAEGPA